MINVAIIGYGYWGKNLVRNFYNHPGCNVQLVVDSDQNKLDKLKAIYPDVSTTLEVEDIYKNEQIDAVIIATPVFSHHKLALQALENGRHVMVEKPMTASSEEARELIELATQKELLLMPDHTFLYTGAVQKIKELVQSGQIGQIKYIDSTRINLGLFQSDINVLWDLAPHDISIVNFILDEQPIAVQATGISHTNNGLENIAYLTLHYQSNVLVHFNCSWTSPVKIRQMLIGGDKKMIVYNDMNPAERVKVYDTGYEIKSDEDRTKLLIDYRAGDIFTPHLNNTEALFAMADDFITSIQNKTIPTSDNSIGLTVVKILEAADKSLQNNGARINL